MEASKGTVVHVPVDAHAHMDRSDGRDTVGHLKQQEEGMQLGGGTVRGRQEKPERVIGVNMIKYIFHMYEILKMYF